MKKILCILIVAALIAVFPGTSAFAAEEPRIVVSSTEAAGGEEIVLTVSIENNPGLTNGCMSVTYDTAGLEFVELDTDSPYWGEIGGIAMNNGPLMNFMTPIETTENGVLFTVTFQVKDNAPGKYWVSLDIRYIVNNANEEIHFEVVPGTVNVSGIECECSNLENVAEVPAEGDNDGVKAHQRCKDCGRRYLDGVLVSSWDLRIPAPGTGEETTKPTDPKPDGTQGPSADPTDPKQEGNQGGTENRPGDKNEPSGDKDQSSGDNKKDDAANPVLPVILGILAVAAVVIVVVVIRKKKN